MSKTITAVFGNGIFTTTAKVFQWDAGDKLQFVGIDLPENYKVDFSNSLTGESKSVLGDYSGVVIPSEYFQPGRMIYAWVVIPDNDGRYTKYQVNIPIYARSEPTDEEPTPEQQSALDEAIAALNEAAEDIPEQIETALQEAKDSGELCDVFWAEYNVTTYAEVSAARTAGKLVVMKRGGAIFFLSHPVNFGIASFAFENYRGNIYTEVQLYENNRWAVTVPNGYLATQEYVQNAISDSVALINDIITSGGSNT